MIPVGTAFSATKGLVKTGQFASDTANVINTTDNILNRLLPEGEGEMPAKDESVYTSKRTVLTHQVMIELLSDNLAKELFRPDQSTEAQSLVQKLLFSCCFPPKTLMQIRISDAGLQDALKIERDPSFSQAMNVFGRVSTGMGDTISQAAWVSRVLYVLTAQLTQDCSATNIQIYAQLLKAITALVLDYYQKPKGWWFLSAIESGEVARLYEACKEHKTIFDTVAAKIPDFDWPRSYQILSGHLNSLSKALKEKIAGLIAGKEVKFSKSITYSDWQKDLAKFVGKGCSTAIMMSLSEYDRFKSLIRSNREMLFRVGDAVDEGVIFYVSTLHALIDFIQGCLNCRQGLQSKIGMASVSDSLWWLNLMMDLSLAMVDGISDSALFNTPFSRSILENTNRRLQDFRGLDQQHRSIPFLSQAIGSISDILGHNDKQFNADNPVMLAMTHVLHSDHSQFTLESLINDLRSVIHYAFTSHRSDRSVFFEEKMQFRLYALAHQSIYVDYKDKARSKMRVSALATLVAEQIQLGNRKIHDIEYIATNDQSRTLSRQLKDEFKEFIKSFKQMIQDNLTAPRRTIKLHGYAYPFLMILFRWGLAYFESDMKQINQGEGVLKLPCSFGASQLIANRTRDLFQQKSTDNPKSYEDIRVGLALT
ncbi:MAG: hypothetical protein CL816_02155 [Coxiellaceae bacterium]|nr:hypothetical protein [Coxiellaceae bacterium]|tara:strand:+ start:14739 stop:16691 length:1953 start_codon:yes stop_codon:yes gene_type:complete